VRLTGRDIEPYKVRAASCQVTLQHVCSAIRQNVSASNILVRLRGPQHD